MSDDLTVRGTVMVECSTCPPIEGCGPLMFWVDALDPRLPDGPFHCMSCECERGGFILVHDDSTDTIRMVKP